MEVEVMADHISKLHQEVKNHLELTNDTYKAAANFHKRLKEYQAGDLVVVYLCKSHFHVGHHSKMTNKCIGPFQIFERLDPNAYQLDLQDNMRIRPSFNVLICLLTMLQIPFL